jgi:hypothetical protein
MVLPLILHMVLHGSKDLDIINGECFFYFDDASGEMAGLGKDFDHGKSPRVRGRLHSFSTLRLADMSARRSSPKGRNILVIK